MRNIKSTLRNTRNSGMLFAAASGLLYLTACSSDVNYDGNVNDIPEQDIESVNVSVLTDPSLATTYTNSHQSDNTTRAAAETFEMPDEPDASVYASLDEYEAQWWAPDCPKKDFKITKDCNLGFNNVGQTMYIASGAKWTISNTYTTNSDDPNATIYVLPGATLEFTGSGFECSAGAHITIYNYGTLAYNGGENQCRLGGNLTVYSQAALDQIPNLNLACEFSTNGAIKVKKVHFNNAANVYLGCKIEATEEVIFDNEATVCVGYIKSPKVELRANPKVILRDGGYIETNNLNIRNVNTAKIYAEDGDYAMVNASTLLISDIDLKNTFNNVAVKYGNLDGDNNAKNNPNLVQWNETCTINDDINNNPNYTIVEQPSDGCAPKIVTNPNDPDVPDPTPTLENIGSIDPTPGHDHPISATCIDVNGNDVYVSWHTQGTGFHGCIEHATIADGKVTLNSYLETSDTNAEYGAIDFNHTIFDNGKLFVAGDHPKKGGILGWIDCNGGSFPTGNTAKLNLIQLYLEKRYVKDETGKEVDKYINGGSGNCIIRNGDYYQTASISGFETFPVNSFDGTAAANTIRSSYKLGSWTFDPSLSERPAIEFNANGNPQRDGTRTGKHIATDGNKVVMLTLIERNNDSNTAKASIKVYSANDFEFKTPLAETYVVNDAVLSPVDGKNVIAIEGDDIWVCLGQGGVQHLKLNGTTITKDNDFVLVNKTSEEIKAMGLTEKQAKESCANGLAVDDKYLYIAHGGAGLVVLDKNTMELVTNTRYHGGKSANYINITEDGYIIVAYGLSKVQVYAWKNQAVAD